ncbi:MAG: DUF2155 domain-containing protein [Acetobacteraceae bacterium]|mgnify:CR=1 FL=1|nr:DUF2155 domain-containing protein [Acetobacteraceae bacterium]
MRRALLAALLSLSLPAFAQQATQPQDQDWLPKRVAELQMLDKVTARVTVLRAPVGEPVRFGALTILVRACNARPPDEVPDAAAFLEMADSRRPADAQEVFRGWMFANAPGVNMLEHPVYDVRVLDCR